jgi:hypothetical protein
MKRLFPGLVGGVLRFNRRARLQPAPVCVADRKGVV